MNTPGHQGGEIARQIYDPAGEGVCIDIAKDGFMAAFEQSARLIEAGGQASGQRSAQCNRGNEVRLSKKMLPPLIRRYKSASKEIQLLKKGEHGQCMGRCVSCRRTPAASWGSLRCRQRWETARPSNSTSPRAS